MPALALAVVAMPVAWAQDKAPASDLGTVEIRSNRNNDMESRRESTASKIVIGREEIDKQGDATISEVLKRLPGVTLGGAPGRGGAIRMRGLGSGYTQILMDGERVPPGFSIDQLTPEQVERIEILRAPTAETGARAIAGTINIVLREGQRSNPDDLKLSLSNERGETSGQLNWVHNLRDLPVQGTFTLSAMDNWHPDESVTQTTSSMRTDRDTEVASLAHRQAIHANARLQWKGEQGRSLTLMPFVMSSQSHNSSQIAVRTTEGTPVSDSAQSVSSSRFTMARLNGQWAQPLSSDDRLELRFGLGQSNYDYRKDQTGALGVKAPGSTQPMLRNGFETQNFTDDSYNLSGKWTRVLTNGHQVVSGLEVEQVHRVEQGNAAVSGEDSGDLQARTRRWAIYTQDEFKINPQWSAYGGLRYENLQTQGVVDGVNKQNDSGVWTPLLHAVYKLDPAKRDQLRMSLTRSYKTPTMYQLIARYVPTLGENSPTQPDRTGNPDLKPELATGIDLAFERYLEQGGILSASVFHRNIRDVIRYVTTTSCLNGVDRCVSKPMNMGAAVTQGLELEAKFRLDQWAAGAWPVDVRSNVSFFKSRVADVPGPDNRLDQQPGYTANLGGDYRLRSWPLMLGGNLNLNPAYDTRRTQEQWVYQGGKWVTDVYGLWRISPATGLRLTVSNLVPLDYVTGSRFNVGNQSEASRTTARNWQTVQLRLEMKI